METNAEPGLGESIEDPLALYESEMPFGGEGEAPRAPSQIPSASLPFMARHALGSITLDQVLKRLERIAWPEAVAIVDSLCATLTGDIFGNARVPELSHISITSQGTVVVGGRAAAGEPGPCLARTIHALTSGGTVPVPLRLFVTKWTSIATEHSLADFSKELAYFARPNGVELIKGVYERAAAVPAVPQTPQPGVVHAPPTPKRQFRFPVSSGRSRRVAVGVAAVCALVAAIVVGRGLWTDDGGATSTVRSLLSKTAGTVQGIAADVTNQAGLTAPASPAPSKPASTPQAVQPASASGSTQSVRGGTGLTRTSGTAPGRPASAGAAAATSTAPGRFPVPTPGLDVPAAAPSDSQGIADGLISTGDAGAQIYSAQDRDVTPPEIRHPQLPPPLLSGVQEDTNTIELIISETGAVERVRLLSTPKRMADMMLLSGAKTWEFEPASRQGRSVRYRLLLTWSASP